MEINTDKRIIEGLHNGVKFRYDGGKLIIQGVTHYKNDIKTLVEIANLLQVHGFVIADEPESNDVNNFIPRDNNPPTWYYEIS